MYSHRFLKFVQHRRKRFVALWKLPVNNSRPEQQFRQDKNTTQRIWFLAHRNLSPPIRTMAEGLQAVFTGSRSRPAIDALFLPYFGKYLLFDLHLFILPTTFTTKLLHSCENIVKSASHRACLGVWIWLTDSATAFVQWRQTEKEVTKKAIYCPR